MRHASPLLVFAVVASLLVPAPPARTAEPAPTWPKILAMDAGDGSSCAIQTDGTLACWGNPTPQLTGTYTAVNVGRLFACAIRTDGRLDCSRGIAPADWWMPAGTFAAVSVGELTGVCAIRTDGTLACWDPWTDQAAPAGTFTAVSAGGVQSCAIRTDGTLACWDRGRPNAAGPAGRHVHRGERRLGRRLRDPDGRDARLLGSLGRRADTACGHLQRRERRAVGRRVRDPDRRDARLLGSLGRPVDTACRDVQRRERRLGLRLRDPDRPHARLLGRSDVEPAAPLCIDHAPADVAGGKRAAAFMERDPGIRPDRLLRRPLPAHPLGREGGVLPDPLGRHDRDAGTFTAWSGSTYCFSARARDSDGITSSWTGDTCTAVPLDDRSLSRSSGWTAGTGSAFYRSTYLRSTTYGAKLTRTGVYAARIALVATTCPTCGTVRVYWGSTLLKTVNLYSKTTINGKVLAVKTFLEDFWDIPEARRGTLTIKVISSGKKVVVDGIVLALE